MGDDFDLAAINAVFEQKSRQLEQNREQDIIKQSAEYAKARVTSRSQKLTHS